jgi:hypothetical protein
MSFGVKGLKIMFLTISIKWMKGRTLGTEICFDEITAITGVKYTMFSVNIRQVDNSEASTSVYSKTRNIFHGMKIISAC